MDQVDSKTAIWLEMVQKQRQWRQQALQDFVGSHFGKGEHEHSSAARPYTYHTQTDKLKITAEAIFISRISQPPH